MTSRPSTAAPILAVLAVVLVTLGAYVGGYFRLGTFSKTNASISVIDSVRYRAGGRWCRIFTTSWQAALYEPLGRMESWFRGVDIELTSSDDEAP
jgi:hypothetical protein